MQNNLEEKNDPHLNGSVCVTPFGSKEKIYKDNGSKSGFVYKGKCTHLFPFDVFSERKQDESPTGYKRIVNMLPSIMDTDQQEGWLNPSKNEHVGYITVSKHPTVKKHLDYIPTFAEAFREKIPENNQNPNVNQIEDWHKEGKKAFVKLSTGKIHEVTPKDLEDYENGVLLKSN